MSKLRYDNGPKCHIGIKGLDWGPLTVYPALSGTCDGREFVDLAMKTRRGVAHIYVTKTGKIRFWGPDGKEWKAP